MPERLPLGHRERAPRKLPQKKVSKAARARKSTGKATPAAKPAPKVTAKPTTSGGPANIRVRMYRVGFGDFFLLTVPGKNGPAHILIDCGVHAANIGSIDECVKDMMKETSNHFLGPDHPLADCATRAIRCQYIRL